MNKNFTATVFGLLVAAGCVSHAADAARKPNVVFLLTDDQGGGDAAA